MRVTKYNATKEYIAQLQQYAKTIAPSMRIVFNDMSVCKEGQHICVSYEIDVHEQNVIQAIEYENELKTSPKTAPNTRIAKFISFIKSWLK